MLFVKARTYFLRGHINNFQKRQRKQSKSCWTETRKFGIGTIPIALSENVFFCTFNLSNINIIYKYTYLQLLCASIIMYLMTTLKKRFRYNSQPTPLQLFHFCELWVGTANVGWKLHGTQKMTSLAEVRTLDGICLDFSKRGDGHYVVFIRITEECLLYLFVMAVERFIII